MFIKMGQRNREGKLLFKCNRFYNTLCLQGNLWFFSSSWFAWKRKKISCYEDISAYYIILQFCFPLQTEKHIYYLLTVLSKLDSTELEISNYWFLFLKFHSGVHILILFFHPLIWKWETYCILINELRYLIITSLYFLWHPNFLLKNQKHDGSLYNKVKTKDNSMRDYKEV